MVADLQQRHHFQRLIAQEANPYLQAL